jgi:hypothetical protein
MTEGTDLFYLGFACAVTLVENCPLVFAAVVKCTTSAFGDTQRRMLKVIQRFGKHCSCHLQSESVLYRQAVGLPYCLPWRIVFEMHPVRISV